jgi:flagellar biogenesis protein FliO
LVVVIEEEEEDLVVVIEVEEEDLVVVIEEEEVVLEVVPEEEVEVEVLELQELKHQNMPLKPTDFLEFLLLEDKMTIC